MNYREDGGIEGGGGWREFVYGWRGRGFRESESGIVVIVSKDVAVLQIRVLVLVKTYLVGCAAL